MADHVEGWDVAPGKIAFSHSGYTPGSSKSAIASDLTAREFSVIDCTDRPHRSDQARRANQHSPRQLSSAGFFCRPRARHLRRSKPETRQTRSFRIGDDAWLDSIWKSINFMYSERCGTEIPGIHGSCHQDIYTIHDDKRIVVNGGYHDAGDLTCDRQHARNGLRPVVARGQPQAARRRPGPLQSSAGRSALGLELGAQNALWRRLSQHRPTGELLDRRHHGRRPTIASAKPSTIRNGTSASAESKPLRRAY